MGVSIPVGCEELAPVLWIIAMSVVVLGASPTAACAGSEILRGKYFKCRRSNSSRHEVTNAQYVEFLNAVAKADPHALFNPQMASTTQGGITRTGAAGSYVYAVKPSVPGEGIGGAMYSYADKPVVFVSYFDGRRFANWLHTVAGAGADTEHGAYDTRSSSNPRRTTEARFFLPTFSEWYKAGYHKNDGVTANYWDFPTGTNVTPNHNLPTLDTGDSANFHDGPPDSSGLTTGDRRYPLTPVGAYQLSTSPYGTFDQGGNVFEVLEDRGEVFGGSWERFSRDLMLPFRTTAGAFPFEYEDRGFRLAAAMPVPEPCSIALVLPALAACHLIRRTRTHRHEQVVS